MTRVVRVDPVRPEASVIGEAAALIRAGRLVAFPTETVYGLGANAFDGGAIERVFAAKGRPADDPLIVHITGVERLGEVVREVPPAAQVLAKRFWPGPLTLVLPRAPAVPLVVTAGRETVAVRVPAHPVALALLAAAAVPVAAPSANRFAHTSPTTAEHVVADLDGRVDLVLDGGPCPVGVESTVVAVESGGVRVLRPGLVTVEALAAALVEAGLAVAVLAERGARGESPGLHAQHYAPGVPLVLVAGPAGAVAEAVVARLRTEEAAGRHPAVLALVAVAERVRRELPRVLVEDLGPDVATAASRLYAALRRLEAVCDVVVAAAPAGEEGLAVALRDRLRRAASEVVEAG